MSNYQPLPKRIQDELRQIASSQYSDELMLYPCRAVLKNGETLNAVYIVPENPYMKYVGIYPEADKAKKSIRIEEIAHVENSPWRLPARFANEIYLLGESGMGYTIFTVAFSDGLRQAYVNGNMVDFIAYPAGKGPSDVVEVLPHECRNSSKIVGPEYYWCLYSEGAPQ